MLRQDERNYLAMIVALASATALVAGASVFFLIRGCGLGLITNCTPYPWQAYAFLPAPTVAVCAIIVQQATAATIRGRLMLGLENALVSEAREEFPLGSGTVPAFASYHLQQTVIHGPRGAAIWTMVFGLPLFIVLCLVYYSGQQLDGTGQWMFYGIYGALLAVEVWAGSPTLRGYRELDSWLVRYLARERRKGRVSL